MQWRWMAWLAAAALAAQLTAAVQKKAKLPPRYDKWLNEEVVYIISDEEKKEFLKLATDQDRDKFIEEFWEVRNPLRGAKRNPFKEEHYQRIQYADEHFGRQSNTPGWMTDMGRTYILFGKPTSRAPFVGYGQIYPLELWFYENSTGSPSLPPFFYVLFFIPEDIGEYRFYHPIIDGPMKLVRGSQFTSNASVYNFLKPLGGDLAHSIFSLIPSEPIDTQTFEPSMTGEMLVSKIQNFANDSFELQKIRELRYLRAKVNSWFMVIQEKPLEIASIVLQDPTGRYWLDYGVLVDDEKYGRRASDGKQLMVNSSFRLLNEKGDMLVEDAEQRAYPAYEAGSEKKFKPFVLANRIPLAPGKYKLEVRLDNREASRTYKGERVIEAGDQSRIVLAGPLMAGGYERPARPDATTPFQYFGIQFLPCVERRFARERPLRMLFQIHLPPNERSRKYELEYVLGHAQDRSIRQTLSDPIDPALFQNGSLLKSKTIPLTPFEPGDYRLVASLKVEGSPQVLASSTVSLKIEDTTALPAFYFLPDSRAAANPAVAAYVRALEAIGQNHQEEAAAFLREALDRNPSNAFAGRALVRIYFSTHKFDQVTQLYNKLGITPFSGAPETLAQVALSFWETGNAEDAKQVLYAAKSYFPKDDLLVAAAKKIGEPAPRAAR